MSTITPVRQAAGLSRKMPDNAESPPQVHKRRTVKPIIEETMLDSPLKQPVDLNINNGLTTFQNYIIAKNSSPLSKLHDRSNN